MIEQDVIDNLLKSADIVSVISSYIHVIKKGRSYVALCPFHDDKHPSLNISKEKQIYKCFSCGEGGNAITFIQHYEKIGFDDAARKLADLVGFHDPRLSKPTFQKHADPSLEALYSCINDLQSYYEYSLSIGEAEVARNYLKERGISQEDIEMYRLGYSPMDGKKTIQYLQAKGHSLKSIEDIGIALARAQGTSDSNAGRLIFPLFDPFGQVVGFSARRLKEEDTAKYINSPETKIFHKGQLLYNYHNARKHAHHDGYVYVLEGFMDTIALGKADMPSAVALMGTNLTKEQISLLRKLNCETRLCLDGDDPGQIGMMKAIAPLQKSGIPFRLVLNPLDKRDPDDIFQSDGPEALKKAMNSLSDPFDFQLNYYLNVRSLSTPEEKRKALFHFLPFLSSVQAGIDRENYINKLAKATGYLPETIRIQLRELIKNQNQISSDGDGYSEFEAKTPSFYKEESSRKSYQRLFNAEREMLYYMLYYKDAVTYFERCIDNFYDPILNKIADIVIDTPSESSSIASFISKIDNKDFDNANELRDMLISLSGETVYPPPNRETYEMISKVIFEERKALREKRKIQSDYQEANGDNEKIELIKRMAEELGKAFPSTK